MKTQYYTATSLDGFIATEDDSIEWLYSLGGDDDSSYPAFIAEVGAIAMGSATYQWIFRHAEATKEQLGVAWPYTQPTWIFTTKQLPIIPGADLKFVRGDVRPCHDEMRAVAGAKNIWIAGGGDLAGQFFDAGLLDEIIVQVGSVTLGKGKPLFPRRLTTPPMQLRSVRQIGTGLAELRYEIGQPQ